MRCAFSFKGKEVSFSKLKSNQPDQEDLEIMLDLAKLFNLEKFQTELEQKLKEQKENY